MPLNYLNIVLDAPFFHPFDYLPPKSTSTPLLVGQRVLVPFGRGTKVGLIIAIKDHTSVDEKRIKPALSILDVNPILTKSELGFLTWVSRYYHHPIGEVLLQALPNLLRGGKTPVLKPSLAYALTKNAKTMDESDFKQAKRQALLWSTLKSLDAPASVEAFQHFDWNWRNAMTGLINKGLVYTTALSSTAQPNEKRTPNFLPNTEQQEAINAIHHHASEFQCHLLEGVTGSGKTEVYLKLIEQQLSLNKQVLVLVPEITLTPQLATRLKQRLEARIALSHSALTDNERAHTWLECQKGHIDVLIGTRSTVFTPLPQLSLIIIDEEHDASFKQQEGFRYCARNMAIARAQRENIPIVMGSATPSFESLLNAKLQRFSHLQLNERAGAAQKPHVDLIDCRTLSSHQHLSPTLINAIEETLEKNEQVILFINRRGFAPAYTCYRCGWVSECTRCQSNMVFHQGINRLRCHHCGREETPSSTCPSCHQPTLYPLGAGTEKLESQLEQRFPHIPVRRIDRDKLQKKKALQEVLEKIHQGGAQLLVGTQMLAKGHHFPNVTLVGIIDIDAGLFSCDFRANERMAQLITQVAGRAGREEKKGRVMIQTRHPEHPVLTTLLSEGYHRFAQTALAERKAAQLPPYRFHALLRVNAIKENDIQQFFYDLKPFIDAQQQPQLLLLGPSPSIMAKRAGRYRYHLLIESDKRAQRHQCIEQLIVFIQKIKSARKVRWSIDIDPIDFY